MAGWYLRRGEKVIGPIKVDKLKESVAAGKLLPTDQLAKDAAGPWTTAGKTKLFAVEQIPPPAPAAPSKTTIVPQALRRSKRALWVVGSIAILTVVSAAIFSILSADDPEPAVAETVVPEPTASEPIAPKPTAQQPKPFEYKILSEEWGSRRVTVEAQVADDVAPTVTEADLESLVSVFMEKYNGEPFNIFFYTETPLVQAWGSISHSPYSTVGEKVDCSIHDYAFDFGPWYFPDRIDRNTKWHKLVWLTLPMVNKIINGATQFHWEVTNRSANEVYFDSKQAPLGAMKDDMSLSPQTWGISTYDSDVPRFVRLVESSLNYLDYEFSQRIVGKLNSVIGSQKYLNGEKTHWEWTIDRLEVTYHHTDGVRDTITIMQTEP